MRLKEFGEDASIDKFIIALRNHIGRAASKHVPAKLNWEALGQMSRANGFEFAADYETFKSMYDSNPIIQKLVKNFNSQGIVLNVPGTSDGPQQTKKRNKDDVEKIAAANAEKNLESVGEGFGSRTGHGTSSRSSISAKDRRKGPTDKKKAEKEKHQSYPSILGKNFRSGSVTNESSSIRKGDKLQINWTRNAPDTGTITGIGADYIKFKLDNDNTPHGDTAAVYFNEFDKYDVQILNDLKDSQDMSKKSLAEDLRERYDTTLLESDRELKKYGISKDKITMYQVKQSRAGNKISWEDAKQHFIDKAKADEKAARAAARKANPKPRKPRQPSTGMTMSKFKKMIKGAAQDFQADFADSEMDLGDVAWDMADSILYSDPDVEAFVRNIMAKNSGRRPTEIKRDMIRDYVADEIYDAGTNESFDDPENPDNLQRFTIQYYDLHGDEIDNRLDKLERVFKTFEVDTDNYHNTSTVPVLIGPREVQKFVSLVNKCPYAKLVSEATQEEYVSEISKDLKARYKEKAGKEVKDLKPWTKKGEYKDLAKNQVARREKGIAKANEASPETTMSALKGLHVWEVWIKNNYYNGKYPDYTARQYPVLATSADEAKQVVLHNADAILKDLLSKKSGNGKKILPPKSALPIREKEIGRIDDGTVKAKRSSAGFVTLFSPSGPMTVKLGDGNIVDVKGQDTVEMTEGWGNEEWTPYSNGYTLLTRASNAARDMKGKYWVYKTPDEIDGSDIRQKHKMIDILRKTEPIGKFHDIKPAFDAMKKHAGTTESKVTEKSVSKAQQKFMGMVHAA